MSENETKLAELQQDTANPHAVAQPPQEAEQPKVDPAPEVAPTQLEPPAEPVVETTATSDQDPGDAQPRVSENAPLERTFADRVRDEVEELDWRLGKLRDFLASAKVGDLPPDEVDRLRAQERCMSGYSSVLHTRLAKNFS